MDATLPPESADALADILHELRLQRRKRKEELKNDKTRRKRLTKSERKEILDKTAGRCHICGGVISGKWQADHVLAHSTGGEHDVDNYLPAHDLCNNYRWDYSEDEFQFILKIGVWARTQIEKRTKVGNAVADKFVAHEQRRANCRRTSVD